MNRAAFRIPLAALAAGPALASAAASLEPFDELELARTIADGDTAAFERMMRSHNRRLFRIARAILRDASEAEDALQEAYLAAYRGLAQFQGQATLSTWLSRLVVNECLGRLRRQRRRDNIAPIFAPAEPESLDRMGTSTLESPDDATMRGQMRTLLERKIDELPEAFRVVFVLRSVEEASVEETALALDIPEATVRTRYFRARGLLREALAREIDLAQGDVFDFGGSHCDRIVAAVMRRLNETL